MSLFTTWFNCTDRGACLVKSPTSETEDTDEEPLECDYDKNATLLYLALEDGAWEAALKILNSGAADVADQTRTWVTRYEPDGSIRWSQLPIHASLVFRAPSRIVQKLVELYPRGARCADDQNYLPLHLAFRHGASANSIWLLMEAFPKAIHAKGHKERTPLDCAALSPDPSLGNIIRVYITKTSKEYEEEMASKLEQKSSQMEQAVEKEKEKVKELEVSTKDLVEKERVARDELAQTRKQMKELELQQQKQEQEVPSAAAGPKKKSRSKSLGRKEEVSVSEQTKKTDNKKKSDKKDKLEKRSSLKKLFSRRKASV